MHTRALEHTRTHTHTQKLRMHVCNELAFNFGILFKYNWIKALHITRTKNTCNNIVLIIKFNVILTIKGN
jgi:hypothetical protein